MFGNTNINQEVSCKKNLKAAWANTVAIRNMWILGADSEKYSCRNAFFLGILNLELIIISGAVMC